VTLPRLTGYDPDDYQTLGRVLSWGLPASTIILGLVIAEHRGLAIRSKAFLLLGAASYATYLLHPVAIGQLVQLPPNQPPLTWLYLFGAVLVTVAFSMAFHFWIEAPILRWMRSLLRERPPTEQQVSANALNTEHN